jgi:hypothetical protein
MGTVNFIDDLPSIRDFMAQRARSEFENNKPISAIEVGFRLCQAGLLVLHFDTRATHERDGEWTMALEEEPTLELPHWQEEYEEAEDAGASFVLLDGERLDIPMGFEDDEIAGVFGKALVAITQDALARDTFEKLWLRDDCQLEVVEFDGMWEWPREGELGVKNLVRDLKAVRLPG